MLLFRVEYVSVYGRGCNQRKHLNVVLLMAEKREDVYGRAPFGDPDFAGIESIETLCNEDIFFVSHKDITPKA